MVPSLNDDEEEAKSSRLSSEGDFDRQLAKFFAIGYLINDLAKRRYLGVNISQSRASRVEDCQSSVTNEQETEDHRDNDSSKENLSISKRGRYAIPTIARGERSNLHVRLSHFIILQWW